MSSNSDLTTITSSSDSKYKRKSSSKKYEKEKRINKHSSSKKSHSSTYKNLSSKLSEVFDNKTINNRVKYVKIFNDIFDKDELREMVHFGYVKNPTVNKYTVNFIKFLEKINGKIKYIKSGANGHTFKGISTTSIDEKKNKTSEVHYGIKIVAYPKKNYLGDSTNKNRPENAELRMIKLLSDLVKSKATPHIVLPLMTFNADISTFVDLKIDNDKYRDFVDKYKKKQFYDKISVLISEWAEGGDLLDFLKKNYRKLKTNHWKVLFFQILSALAIIQSIHPSFRHNDLKANNILVQKTNKDKKTYAYDIDGNYFVVPNIGFTTQIWDFDFSCIPDVVDNDKVSAEWTNKINITPEKNRYYDIHYFFTTLTMKPFLGGFFKSSHIDDEIKEFVLRVVPPKYRIGSKLVYKHGRILVNKEITTPLKLLMTDPLFKAFRVVV